MLISEFLIDFERRWPLATAESWDNPGAAYLAADIELKRVLICIDVTADVIHEAKSWGAQLVISHHPVIFRPIDSLAGASASQAILREAISAGVSLYSAHTNVDHVVGGVSEQFALALGLTNLTALDSESGHGRIGDLTEELSLDELAGLLVSTLPGTSMGILVQGERDMTVSRVALLAGSGDSFLEMAAKSDVDVFITSDLKHHRALDFRLVKKEKPQGLISVSHWAAESLWLGSFAQQLQQLGPTIEFQISRINTDPWDFRK